jgi:hypothetical protein
LLKIKKKRHFVLAHEESSRPAFCEYLSSSPPPLSRLKEGDRHLLTIEMMQAYQNRRMLDFSQ